MQGIAEYPGFFTGISPRTGGAALMGPPGPPVNYRTNYSSFAIYSLVMRIVVYGNNVKQ